MPKHYLVGLKLTDIKKQWLDLLQQLEADPPICVDATTPLSEIAPPDESCVRVMLYRSIPSVAGVRIGHAQKSESLWGEWSFAYRYLEQRGKTIIARRGPLKLCFRSVQRLRSDSTSFFLFVQLQSMGTSERAADIIDIDSPPMHPDGIGGPYGNNWGSLDQDLLNPNPYFPPYDHVSNPYLSHPSYRPIRIQHGFTGLFVEDDEESHIPMIASHAFNNPPVGATMNALGDREDYESQSLVGTGGVGASEEDQESQYCSFDAARITTRVDAASFSYLHPLVGTASSAPLPPWRLNLISLS